MNGIIFDLDGTLINSLEDLADACNHVLKEARLPPHPVKSYRHFVGDGVYKLLERALPQEERTTERISFYKALFDARYQTHCMDKTRPYPGVLPLLRELNKRGYRLCVLSNKPDAFVKQIVSGLFGDGMFDEVRGQIEGLAKKPAPDGVNALLDALGAVKSEAVLVGDSDVDVITAKNASLPCIGVSWGFRGAEELRHAGADAVIDHPEELLAALDGVFPSGHSK